MELITAHLKTHVMSEKVTVIVIVTAKLASNADKEMDSRQLRDSQDLVQQIKPIILMLQTIPTEIMIIVMIQLKQIRVLKFVLPTKHLVTLVIKKIPLLTKDS
jgi:ABC-type methionine transport system permease subunit